MDSVEKKELASSDMVEDLSSKGDVEILNVDSLLQELAKAAPPFYKNHNLLLLYLLMIPGCLVPSVTLGFDSAMMNGLQAVGTWSTYFSNPRSSILGLMTAILSLGAICATPFITMIGDRYGRRKALWFGSVVMAIGGIIQGASVNIGMFLLGRFLIGFGLVFPNVYAPILIGELSHPKDREVATSLYETSWYFGATCAAWVTFGTFNMPNNWAWRIPSLLQAAPALAQIVAVPFLPESPRWLIATGQADSAKKTLTKYHADGVENDALVELEFSAMKRVIEADVANHVTWKSLWTNRSHRRRMMVMVMLGCFSQWSGNGLVSYYLSSVLENIGIGSNREKNIINGSLMIWNWMCSISSAFLAGKIRRRTQFLVSTAGMLTIFASQTLCTGLFEQRGDKPAGNAVIALLFLFYSFYNLAWNALLYAYPVELLPYSIRGKGFSVLMFAGKAANFINAFVNPIGMAAIGWKYYFVYVGWLAVEVVCIYFFLTETKGLSLEAISTRLERDEKESEEPQAYHDVTE